LFMLWLKLEKGVGENTETSILSEKK
jgi:hypothetical protein